MKKILACFMMLVTMAGCAMGVNVPNEDGSKPVHVVFHADKSFQPVERNDLQAAADEWTTATGGLAQIVINYDMIKDDPRCKTEPCLYRNNSNDPDVLIEDIEAGCPDLACVLGWVNTRSAHKLASGKVAQEMHMIPERDGRDFKMVAMHEFGHVLGLSHIMDRWALMFPGKNSDQKGCVTQSDISEYCRVNACGTHRMKPCD